MRLFYLIFFFSLKHFRLNIFKAPKRPDLEDISFSEGFSVRPTIGCSNEPDTASTHKSSPKQFKTPQGSKSNSKELPSESNISNTPIRQLNDSKNECLEEQNSNNTPNRQHLNKSGTF